MKEPVPERRDENPEPAESEPPRKTSWWEHAFWMGCGLAIAVGLAGTLGEHEYVGEAAALLFLAFAVVLRRLTWAR